MEGNGCKRLRQESHQICWFDSLTQLSKVYLIRCAGLYCNNKSILHASVCHNKILLTYLLHLKLFGGKLCSTQSLRNPAQKTLCYFELHLSKYVYPRMLKKRKRGMEEAQRFTTDLTQKWSTSFLICWPELITCPNTTRRKTGKKSGNTWKMWWALTFFLANFRISPRVRNENGNLSYL